MNFTRLVQCLAAVLLCFSGASCSLFKKDGGDAAQYPQQDGGGYNPYSGQPGQPSNQPYAAPQQPQQYAQQPQQYQTYNQAPPQDYAPQPDYTPQPSRSTTKKPSSHGGGGYTVKQGDTLYRIALNHGTTVSRLKSTNGLNSDLIHPGQQLTLP